MDRRCIIRNEPAPRRNGRVKLAALREGGIGSGIPLARGSCPAHSHCSSRPVWALWCAGDRTVVRQPRDPGSVPQIKRVLETALYVDDLGESARFYEAVLGLTAISRGDRLVALDAGEGTVLLLFRRGAMTGGASFAGGRIPPHDGEGRTHFAFAVAAGELDRWRGHLGQSGVEIESEVTWDRGGTSLYFRDPSGHSIELATPGVWEVY